LFPKKLTVVLADNYLGEIVLKTVVRREWHDVAGTKKPSISSAILSGRR